MPFAPKRPCKGCHRATEGKYCPACQESGAGKEHRPSATQRGYNSKWSKVSKEYRTRHPLCADPYALHKGRLVPGDLTDHIIPHRGDPALMWDEANNFQTLCRGCHGVKTAREDGGYGNAIRPGSRRTTA
jgi:5-methylcytosine-specific restriction enzyme A